MHPIRHTTTATVPERSVAPAAPAQRRYHPDALRAVSRMLATAGAEVAAFVTAVVQLRGERRGPDQRGLKLDALAAALAVNRDGLVLHLLDIDFRVTMAFAIGALDPGWRRQALLANPPDQAVPITRSVKPRTTTAAYDEPAIDDGQVLLSPDLVDLLDTPHPPAEPSPLAPVLDDDGRRAMTVIAALARSGKGAHLALRRRRASTREPGDLAALVAKFGAEFGAETGAALLVVDETREGLMPAVLRAELHAGAAPPVVLLARDLLASAAAESDGFDDDASAPARADELKASELAAAPPAALRAVRGLYLWSVPADGDLPAAVLPWLAGCLGPLRHDPAWARALVADHLGPGVAGDPATSPGVRAILRRLVDPRDAGAVAGAARTLAAASVATLDEAAVMLAASFSDRPPAPAPAASRFDPRLLVCGADALALLDRAAEAASRGARVLAHGPPGGGKSAYVRELAGKMAGSGPVRLVTPADFLARAWGATERQVRQLWRRAADEGEVLVADEFEVIAGRRVMGDTGNNALLVRSLTDAWLLALDDHPGVPLLATTNDVAAVDPAVRRRFNFVLAVSDALSPAQERLAWSVLLGCEPPAGWRACGAAAADVVLAQQRCRMLGRNDPASLAAAVATARSERTGAPAPSGKAKPEILH